MGSNREDWQKLAHESAQGAIYDSSERYPHSKCLPTTRVDIIRDLRALNDNSDRKIVWISGEPGSGKSSIAHTLADQLRDEGKLVGTFFFSRKHAKRSTFNHVLLTLAYQLGLQHPRARDVIAKAISDDPTLLTTEKSRRDQLEKLVIAALKELAAGLWKGRSGLSLILDALDEGTADGLHHLKPFISTIIGLLRNHSLPIHNIVITSRLWPKIRAVMHSQEFTDIVRTVRLEDYDSYQDVDLFLEHSFELIYDSHALSEFSIKQPWPTRDDFLMLSERAHGRFIFAATIIRLIDQDEPWDRIQLVGSMLRGNVEHIWGDIDYLYASIMDSVDAPTRDEAQKYLRLIVNLAEPLPVAGLRDLFTIDINSLLLPFSALIYVPPPGSPDVVQIYHTSFRDFLQKHNESGKTQADIRSEHHYQLSIRCFKTMARLLKRDICGLHDPSLLHEEIPGFSQKRDSVARGLVYSCRHWLYHLQQCTPDGSIWSALCDFVERRLLFIVEAYAVLGELGNGVQVLRAARTLITGWSQSSFSRKDLVLALLYDAWRMTLDFFDPISSSALHVYESALPCCPLQSCIRATYGLSEAKTVVFEEGLDDQWSCVTRVIDARLRIADAHAIALSPDGSKLVVSTQADGRRAIYVRVWDTATGLLMTSLEVPFNHSPSMHYNGHYLVLCGDPRRGDWEFSMWHLPSGTQVSLEDFHTGETRPCAAALSYDGLKIAFLSFPATDSDTFLRIRIYAIETRERLLDHSVDLAPCWKYKFSYDTPKGVEFSHRDDLLILYVGGHILVFSTISGQLRHVKDINCAGFWPRTRRILSSPNGDWVIHLINTTDGTTEIEMVAVEDSTNTSKERSHMANNPQSHTQKPTPKPLIEPIIYSQNLIGVKFGDQVSSICGSSKTLWVPQSAECIGAFVDGVKDEAAKSISIISVRQASLSIHPQRSASTTPSCVLKIRDKSIYAYRSGGGFYLVDPKSETGPSRGSISAGEVAFRFYGLSPKSTYVSLTAQPSSLYSYPVSEFQVWELRSRTLLGTSSIRATQFHQIIFSEDETVVAADYTENFRQSHFPAIAVFSLEEGRLHLLAQLKVEPEHYIRCEMGLVNGDAVDYWSFGYSPVHLRWKRATNETIQIATQPWDITRWLSSRNLLHSPGFTRMSYDNNIATLKQPATRDGLEHEWSYEVESFDEGFFYDTLSWSDLCLDADGWFRKGERRLCWLPKRYRPEIPNHRWGKSTGKRHNTSRFKIEDNRVTILNLGGERRITFRLLNTEIQFFE